MIKSFKKQYGKITSIILAIAMLVTGLPVDLLGGIASVKAAEPKEYIATSGAIDDYFTLTTGPSKDANDDKGNSKKFVQLWDDSVTESTGRIKLEGKGGDSGDNAIKFTVSEGLTASVQVWGMSGNSDNASQLALYDTDAKTVVAGPAIAYNTKSTDKGYNASDSKTEWGKVDNPITLTLSAEGLKGGKTYHIATPADAATAATVYWVRVVESVGSSTGTGTGDGTDDGTDDGKDYIATSGAIDEFFALTDGAVDDPGQGKKYAQLWDDSVKQSTGRIKLNGKGGADGKNAISFTVRKGYTASIEVWGMSTNSDATSKLALYDTAAKTVVAGPEIAYNSKSTEKGYKDSDSEWGKEANPITLTLSAEGLEGGKTYHVAAPTDAGKDAAIYWIRVVERKPSASLDSYVLNPSTDITPFGEGAKQDGETEQAGTNKFFTVQYSAKSKVDASAKKDWKDPIVFEATHRLNFGGVADIEKNSIKFTTTQVMDVQVWWRAGAAGEERQIVVMDSEGKEVAATKGKWETDKPLYDSFNLATPGTYYLGNKGGNNYIFRVEVSKPGDAKPPRADWEPVDPPEITAGPALDETDPGKIIVKAKGFVGYDGADSLNVDMIDAKGEVVKTETSTTKTSDEQTFTFVPTASGDYTFMARLVRADEDDKKSDETKVFTFKLPMTAPIIKSLTNKGTTNGKGNLEVAWQKVNEARNYKVTVTSVPTAEGETEKKLTEKETSQLQITVGGLEIGSTVKVSVVAIGKNGKSEPGTGTKLITGETDRTWAFTTYGSSINRTDNGYIENKDGSVTVYSENGKGKIVPGSTDGLAYYYTAIDPDAENFTLTADVHVDKWKYSNGQDGFGLMVADAVGESGNGDAFWNNSYQLISTKIEYRWDKVNNAVTTVVDLEKTNRYSMRLGLGWIAKEGVTATDVAKVKKGELTTPGGFTTKSGTLETSAARAGAGGVPLEAGDYNIIANAEPKVSGTYEERADFKLQIQRNNTGYILRYLDKDGNLMDGEQSEQIFYDIDRNKLTQIDKKNIYVGFIAGRNARITVSNIDLKTIDPEEDAKAQEQETTYVDPSYRVLSSNTSNSENYQLISYINMDGHLTVINETTGEVVVDDAELSANKRHYSGATLVPGDNKLVLTFVPDQSYTPGVNQEMTSEAKKTYSFSHHVNYKSFESDIIYVKPNVGTNDGNDGTNDGKERKGTNDGNDGTNDGNDGSSWDKAVDIYTAVAYAHAGQKIYLAGGKYDMKNILLIDRAHNGTEEEPIYLMAAPDAKERPVLDFTNQKEFDSALTLVGHYWYLKGFDVTHSKDGQKGIQVSGSYNVLEDIRTYWNGNTGLQIARYSNDSRADWPAYNTILNCTSYLNADSGYEDADGFACKLTAGDGNKFIGCIAAYNADDGWDLFAKVQDGSIGAVTIDNCIAYKNGYVLGYKGATKDDPDIWDEKGGELPAGNGNGFKMGGDGLSGYHVLKNSIAFGNKAKGIDSNSCPDNIVYNCTSFENEGNNVGLYTYVTNPDTDYDVRGVLSFKVKNKTADDLKPQGRQLRYKSKIYNDTNYYFDGSKSLNKAKGDSNRAEATADWFKSTDMAAVLKLGGITRDADGSINMHGFLELTDKAPENVGARLGSTSSSSVFDKLASVNVYASTVTQLKGVKLPAAVTDAGYDWKYPETAVAVFAGTSTDFIVSAKGKDDKTVTVNFIEVTGLEFNLKADTKLIGNDTLKLEAVPVVAPAVKLENVQGNATFTYDIKESSKLKLTVAAVDGQANAKNVSRGTASGEGLAKFTATLTAKIGNKTTKKQATCTFTTRKENFDITYTVDPAEYVKTDGSIIVPADKTFTLKGLKAEGVGSNTSVKVSVSDSKVIKASGSGADITITAVGEGTATITLTSAADKTAIERIPVTVRGLALKTNVSTITVDKAKIAGVQITALACYGEKLDDGSVTVKSVLKGKSATSYGTNFTVSKVVGNIYSIGVNDVKVPKGTYNLVLQGTIGGVPMEFDPLVVKVIETKPTVTFKQTKKVNLFYTAGSTSGNGTLTATSKLAKVTLKQEGANDKATHYRLSNTGSNYRVVLKSSAAKERTKNKKITVVVSFAGYKSDYDKKMTINVASETRAPKLKLEVDNKVLYTQLGIFDTKLRVYDTTTKNYVTGADVALASSTASYVNANKNFWLDQEDDEYILSAEKSGTARISVKDADWTKEVVVNQPITVNKNKPRAVFSVARLNSNPEYAGKEQAISVVTVKNALDFKVKDFDMVGTNAKAKALKEYLDYKVAVNDEGQNELLISLKEPLPYNGNRCQFSGSYTFNATFTLNKLTTQTAKVKVTLVPVATVTTSQKGSIDLLNRTGSSITVKPNLKNLTGTVVGMTLDDDASNLFNVKWDKSKGSAVVTAKKEVDMKKGVRYKVTPVFLVETVGGVVKVPARAINIIPKQSNVKLTKIPMMEARLSATGTPARTIVKATSPANVEILDMVQMNNTDNFKAKYDASSGTFTVKIIDAAGLKAGSTYKITMALDVKDAGVNTKQQMVTVSVKVLK